MAIDLKVSVLGDKEIAATFRAAQSGLRAELQQELDEIGKDIVIAARSRVPRRTGSTMSRIVYRHGRKARGGYQHVGDDRLMLTVLPGEPTAHLIERGVNAMVTKARRSKAGDVSEVKGRRQKRKVVALGVRFGAKPYKLVIKPQPYFTPAVESVGGSAGVNVRLQAAVSRVAARAQQGGG